jgi:hypothetical protein
VEFLVRPLVICGGRERILKLWVAVSVVRLVNGAGFVRMHGFEQFPENLILAHALGALRFEVGREVSRGSARGEFICEVKKKAEL